MRVELLALEDLIIDYDCIFSPLKTDLDNIFWNLKLMFSFESKTI